jgi:hypothetical protein
LSSTIRIPGRSVAISTSSSSRSANHLAKSDLTKHDLRDRWRHSIDLIEAAHLSFGVAPDLSDRHQLPIEPKSTGVGANAVSLAHTV